MTTANDIPRGPLAAIAREPWRWAPHTFAHYVSGGQWRPFAHLRVIGETIADAVAAGGGRIIVNCPPRHGKSELISHWTPTWMLDSLPASRVILCSYESGIATGWGRMVRNEFESNDRLRVRLRPDIHSVFWQRCRLPRGQISKRCWSLGLAAASLQRTSRRPLRSSTWLSWSRKWLKRIV